MAHISAFVALLWVALYSYRTLAEPQLGYAVFGLALVYLPLIFYAIDDDAWILFGVHPLRRGGGK